MIITSVNNDKIKYIKSLKQNKNIEKEGKFIVETKNLVEEAMKSGILLETISLEECNYNVANTVVSDNVMKSISNLSSIPDVIGICKIDNEEKELGNKIIILDDLQDPGNLGTIIRSSCAFNFDSIILSLNSVNKYNDKVIRSSEGMIFKKNVVKKDLIEFIPYLKSLGYKVYATDVVNGINVKDVDKDDKLAIIIGNEGNGISEEIKALADKNIYINMNSNCESLNAAVAASILMYEIDN